ncbi:hypothetical protein Taro_006232 [Colocasia esculenta]|uniref:poly(A)-specific ribonuclease n=1 Tax=Colocasia esculenta TaxID=4460 RepID=A0A843TRW7_COLES|nr:hypothetical protein [Colocasia esculenta]
MAMEGAAVREVWAANLMEEMPHIAAAAESSPLVAVDTEFSGFLRQTPRHASMEELYEDVRYNVEQMELVQVGFTFFDLQSSRQRTWQINVACRTDILPPSVKLQRRSGIDLERNRDEGVDVELLSDLLLGSGSFSRRPGRTWVTFHGIYDLSYLVKLLGRSPLPDTLACFALLTGDLLGSVVDTKYLARFCGEQFRAGELGLQRLSQLLRVRSPGVLHHQAGYDSLLTAMAFQKMIHRFPHLLEEELEGFVWGIEGCRIEPEQQLEVDDQSFLVLPIRQLEVTPVRTVLLPPAPFLAAMPAWPLPSPCFY